MAVKVENTTPIHRSDRFKVQCRRCGRELSYCRRDVLSHRRWPNGFIYCPICKTPNGHREDNLVESGQVYEINEAARKQEETKKLAEQYSIDGLKEEISRYSIIKTVFFIIGIPLMAISFTFIAISGTLPIHDSDLKLFAILSTTVAPFVFAVGSALFIIALVLTSKVRKRKELLEIKEREERLKNSNQ